MDLVGSPVALRRWAIASLVANLAIVVTGGLVRVTSSGLGCSTWPQCEPGSYIPHPDAGIHAYIEFGNRLLTFVLVIVAIGTLLAAWRARDAGRDPQGRQRRARVSDHRRSDRRGTHGGAHPALGRSVPLAEARSAGPARRGAPGA